MGIDSLENFRTPVSLKSMSEMQAETQIALLEHELVQKTRSLAELKKQYEEKVQPIESEISRLTAEKDRIGEEDQRFERINNEIAAWNRVKDKYWQRYSCYEFIITKTEFYIIKSQLDDLKETFTVDTERNPQ